jgi:SAM-dependent methyltransferase
MNIPATNFSGNVERFSGFADLYDKYRPEPPAILASILTGLADAPTPDLVVDLGCGTGLSTRYWADKAHQVVGIEPAADMRRQAEARTASRNITYRDGFSHQTGLPDHCAEIVTCSQSLHWMEPQSTFQEVARILVPGGVFAAYDYDWPPTTSAWQADAAYVECIHNVQELEKTLTPASPPERWEKHEHLSRMRASRCFRFTKEIVVHHVDQGNAERLIGLLFSQGAVMTLIKNGFTEAQIGIDRFRDTVERALGSGNRTWVWSSRIRLGIA